MFYKRKSVFEEVKGDWVGHLPATTELDQRATDQITPSTSHLYMGWAFHNKCGSTRFFEKVRNHLIKKFYIVQEIGRREDPGQVAKDMKPKRREGVFKIRFKSEGFPESFESVCSEHCQSREGSEAQCSSCRDV